MIKTFRDKETEKIFNRIVSRKLPINIQQLARRKMVILDAATELYTASYIIAHNFFNEVFGLLHILN